MTRLSQPVSEQDHVQGSAQARYTLVEYGDYQCPDCGMAFAELKKVRQHFGDRLRFVFRNFPLDQHEFAEPAAETAEFAAAHGKFWEMHDGLYEHQEEFNDELFDELAQEAGLDTRALDKALADGSFADRVADDVRSGEASNVQGTPTFYINGFKHNGSYDAESLIAAIQVAHGA